MFYYPFVFAKVFTLMMTSYPTTQNNDDFEYYLFEYDQIKSTLLFNYTINLSVDQ